jgi:GxxExxY protein
MGDLKHAEITNQIIKGFYQVYNSLGIGFLEKVYENALAFEISQSGLLVEQQKPINVFYKGKSVGEYYADLIIENVVVVELKAAEKIIEAHEAQLLNYLRATKIEVGLLLNFGQKPEYRRKLYTNDKKNMMDFLLNQ